MKNSQTTAKAGVIENEIYYTMACPCKVYPSASNCYSNVTASFTVTMCLAMALGLMFSTVYDPKNSS